MLLIVELSPTDLHLMGALLHDFLKKNPKSKSATHLLTTLAEQTDVVRMSGSFHPLEKVLDPQSFAGEDTPNPTSETYAEYYQAMIAESANAL